jgi:hypothetical protein
LSVTSAFRLNWPSSFRSLLGIFSSLNFNIEIIAPECTVNAGYWDKWWIVLSLPFIMAATFTLVFLALQVVKRIMPKTEKLSFLFTIDYFINSYIMFLSLAHPYLTAKSLEVFNCISDGGGNWYMVANQTQLCYVHSWAVYEPWAIIGIIVYGLGIPIGFFVILWIFRKKLHQQQFGQRFGSLYYCYARKNWYWEVVVKLRYLLDHLHLLNLPRKFLLVVVRFIFHNGDNGSGTTWTATFGTIILVVYLVVVSRVKPFRYKKNNVLQNLASVINLMYLVCGILFFTGKFDEFSESFVK